MESYMVMITVRRISGEKIDQSLVRVSYKLMPRNGVREIRIQGLTWGLLLGSISLKHLPEQNKIFIEIHTLWGVIRGW